MGADFKECIKCKPPKRHPGCQDTCPDYIRDKTKHEEKLKKIRDAKAIDKAANDYRAIAQKRMKCNRGKKNHAK